MSESEQNGQVENDRRAVEGPPSLGAWLGQTYQSETGQARLEWQQSVNNQTQHQLRQVLPPKVIFNPTIERDARDESVAPFSLRKLRSAAEFIDARHFDGYVPHEELLKVFLEEPETLGKRNVFPGSAICAELGVLLTGEAAVTHFYVVGMVTGRRGNELSVLFPQDAINTSKYWSPAPMPEHRSVVTVYPTPILDVKVHSTRRGNVFGIRTQSLITLLPFFRRDELRGAGDIRHFHWFRPLHLNKECFGGRSVADFSLNPYPARVKNARSDALIVDDSGGLWQTRPGVLEAKKATLISPYAAVEQLRAGTQGDGRSPFARVAFGNTPNTAVVAREDAVRVFNLEEHHLDFSIFMVPDSKTRILDMAQPTRQHPSTPYRVICTTEEVVWLDLDRPDVPALRCKHYRDMDNTLSLHSAFCEGVCHTFLWSRITSAVTVYTHPAFGPAQLILPPYDLPPPAPNIRRWGLTTIQTSMKQRYKALVPEALVLIETAEDGTVYQRELVSEDAPNLHSDALGKERVEHKRIAAQNPLSGLPVEDPKRFRVAHLFMLYNRLYSNQPSLHKRFGESSILQLRQDEYEDVTAKIPLDIVQVAEHYSADTVDDVAGPSTFTSTRAVDAACIPIPSIKRELDRLSLTDKADWSYRIPKDLMGAVSTDPDIPTELSGALQDMYSCMRHRQSSGASSDQVSKTEAAHRFACDQIAMDLALSRQVISMQKPLKPTRDVFDTAMTSYDRLAELPEIEYGYFSPVDSNGNTPTSDAARALLSEWTLGADPSIRPPFVNPYGQQIKDHKAANTQLKAFKTRIATGAGVSASQPLPGMTQPARRFAKLSDIKRGTKGGELPIVPRDAPASQLKPEIQMPSSTQSETQPIPLTQMLPGAHGGRPAAKKRKKRTGGF